MKKKKKRRLLKILGLERYFSPHKSPFIFRINSVFKFHSSHHRTSKFVFLCFRAVIEISTSKNISRQIWSSIHRPFLRFSISLFFCAFKRSWSSDSSDSHSYRNRHSLQWRFCRGIIACKILIVHNLTGFFFQAAFMIREYFRVKCYFLLSRSIFYSVEFCSLSSSHARKIFSCVLFSF